MSRVSELPVAAAHAYLLPTVGLEDRDCLVNLLRHGVVSDAAVATGRRIEQASILAWRIEPR
jgi:hypothetical protein